MPVIFADGLGWRIYDKRYDQWFQGFDSNNNPRWGSSRYYANFWNRTEAILINRKLRKLGFHTVIQ